MDSTENTKIEWKPLSDDLGAVVGVVAKILAVKNDEAFAFMADYMAVQIPHCIGLKNRTYTKHKQSWGRGRGLIPEHMPEFVKHWQQIISSDEELAHIQAQPVAPSEPESEPEQSSAVTVASAPDFSIVLASKEKKTSINPPWPPPKPYEPRHVETEERPEQTEEVTPLSIYKALGPWLAILFGWLPIAGAGLGMTALVASNAGMLFLPMVIAVFGALLALYIIHWLMYWSAQRKGTQIFLIYRDSAGTPRLQTRLIAIKKEAKDLLASRFNRFAHGNETHLCRVKGRYFLFEPQPLPLEQIEFGANETEHQQTLTIFYPHVGTPTGIQNSTIPLSRASLRFFDRLKRDVESTISERGMLLFGALAFIGAFLFLLWSLGSFGGADGAAPTP